MRILYIHQHYRSPENGGGTRPYEFTRRLAADGHEVRVLAAKPTGDSTPVPPPGVDLRWIGRSYSGELSYKARKRVFADFALRAVLHAVRWKPDVLLASSTPLTVAIPALAARIFRGTPYVLEVRDVWPELPIAIGALRRPLEIYLARQLEHLSYRFAASIVVLSPDMKVSVESTAPAGCQIAIVPNCADLEEIERSAPLRVTDHLLGVGAGDPVLLYAGSLGPVNDVGYLVRLAHATVASKPNARFVVIGGGPATLELLHYAQRTGLLNRNLFYFPPLPKADVFGWFKAATVSLSSFVDIEAMAANSANKVFDSLGAGTPVAINYGGWQADLLRQCDAGIQLSRNPEVAAVQLSELVSDTFTLARMAENARNLAIERFSRDANYKVFSQVLSSAGS